MWLESLLGLFWVRCCYNRLDSVNDLGCLDSFLPIWCHFNLRWRLGFMRLLLCGLNICNSAPCLLLLTFSLCELCIGFCGLCLCCLASSFPTLPDLCLVGSLLRSMLCRPFFGYGCTLCSELCLPRSSFRHLTSVLLLYCAALLFNHTALGFRSHLSFSCGRGISQRLCGFPGLFSNQLMLHLHSFCPPCPLLRCTGTLFTGHVCPEPKTQTLSIEALTVFIAVSCHGTRDRSCKALTSFMFPVLELWLITDDTHVFVDGVTISTASSNNSSHNSATGLLEVALHTLTVRVTVCLTFCEKQCLRPPLILYH
mmetsp:Transcript_8579/g.16225  ORF Transcript_8579/g.16225 Transcript_8579/m.16225 type:complete len:311 (+) Transcript_8579:100-1032(+)